MNERDPRSLAPKRKIRRQFRLRHPKPPRSAGCGSRLLLAVLIAAALIVLLLRLIEFSHRRARNPHPVSLFTPARHHDAETEVMLSALREAKIKRSDYM
jgi:hypothetical protein